MMNKLGFCIMSLIQGELLFTGVLNVFMSLVHVGCIDFVAGVHMSEGFLGLRCIAY